MLAQIQKSTLTRTNNSFPQKKNQTNKPKPEPKQLKKAKPKTSASLWSSQWVNFHKVSLSIFLKSCMDIQEILKVMLSWTASCQRMCVHMCVLLMAFLEKDEGFFLGISVVFWFWLVLVCSTAEDTHMNWIWRGCSALLNFVKQLPAVTENICIWLQWPGP